MIAATSAVVMLKNTMDIAANLFATLSPLMKTESDIEIKESIEVILEVTVRYLAMWEKSSGWKGSVIRKKLHALKAALFETVTWQPDGCSYAHRVMSVLTARGISGAYCLRLIQLPAYIQRDDNSVELHRQSRCWMACKFDNLFEKLDESRGTLSSGEISATKKYFKYKKLTKDELFAEFDRLKRNTSLMNTDREYTSLEVEEIDKGEKSEIDSWTDTETNEAKGEDIV